jgi:hypothetical protein
VVALLFLLSGLGAIWRSASLSTGAVDPGGPSSRSLHLNLGLLAFPVGVGLLRAQPAWRWVGLALTALGMGAGLFMAVLLLTSGTASMTVSMRTSETALAATSWQALLMMGSVLGLLLWSTHVLFRRDTREWMRAHATQRPWIEWATLFVMLLLARGL